MKTFDAIIKRRGRDVSRDGTTAVLKVILSPQKGENRRATKFLEPNEFWLFSMKDLSPVPSEGDIYLRDSLRFLIVETQYDTQADTLKCGVYLLPFEVKYYAPSGTLTADAKLEYKAEVTLYANKEEVGRVINYWDGPQNEDTESFIIPPVTNAPQKGVKLKWQNKETIIDKVHPLYSSTGKFIGWRLKG